MQIAVVGLGYVGLVTAAGFARHGHDVVGIERDRVRLDSLRAGRVPIHEPGLATLLADAIADGHLTLSSSATSVAAASIVIIAVGTDDGAGGWQTDMIEACLSEVVPELAEDAVLAIRSTLPPAFVERLETLVGSLRRRAGRGDVPILLNPEFTSEGTAVRDFFAPDRIVIGVVTDPRARGGVLIQDLYSGFAAPILVQDAIDACLTKIASNLFLAAKISFANELASLCEIYGAGVDAVVDGMAYDSRIGGAFLRPGVGYGGSCLPTQIRMIVQSGREAGLPMRLLGAVDDVNRGQIRHVVGLLESRLGGLDDARIALLGLAFKPGTDDVREAPALALAAALAARGASVVAYDPMIRARERVVELVPMVRVEPSAALALSGADAAVLTTEWPEFRALDWADAIETMHHPIVIDGRNALDPIELRALGCDYVGFGIHRATPGGHGPSEATRPPLSAEVSRPPTIEPQVNGRTGLRRATPLTFPAADVSST